MYQTLSTESIKTLDKEKITTSLNLFNKKMHSLLPLCDQMTLALIKSHKLFEDDARPFAEEIKSYINITAPIEAQLI